MIGVEKNEMQLHLLNSIVRFVAFSYFKVKKSSCFSNLIRYYLPELHVWKFVISEIPDAPSFKKQYCFFHGARYS